MKGRKLALSCPVCGSTDVVYTCEPKCCWNHVCGACGCTFEPVTRAAGERLDRIEPPDPLPDSSDPTAACAVCESTQVYALEDGRLACAACGQVLELELTAISPG